VAVWKCGGFTAIAARGYEVEDRWIGRRQLSWEGPAGRAPITSHGPASIQSVPSSEADKTFQIITYLVSRGFPGLLTDVIGFYKSHEQYLMFLDIAFFSRPRAE
jgi:hypothetical protein